MNLSPLSDNQILSNFKQLTSRERHIIVETLHYFREVEVRRLFCDEGFESLREFAIEYLKYSGNEADRRIAAMRLMRELPGIELKILDGSLNLTNINLARVLFRKEKKAGRSYTEQEKRDIMKRFENVSTRTAEKIAAQINPDMAKPELSFEAIQDDALREKLLRLKGRRAHKDPHLSLCELLHELADKELAEEPSAPMAGSRADTSQKIYERDHAECTNCGSYFAIQEDHIIPEAAGGETSVENMRLLCRNCNLRAAVKFYGRKKMNDYLSDVRRPYGASHKHDLTRARPRMRQTSTQKRNAYN